MAQSNWEADKMLDVYIYDYLVKRNLQASAKAFLAEGKVSSDPVAIDAPNGFLFEWWSVFWDIFIARTNDKHSEVAASYIETQQLKAREQQLQHQQQQQQLHNQQLHQQQQLQMQQLQLMQRQQPRRDLNLSSSSLLGGADALLRQPSSTANAIATRIYEERLKPPQRDATMDDASMKRPMLQTTANTSASLQQVQSRSQQLSANSQGMDLLRPGVQQKSMLQASPSSFQQFQLLSPQQQQMILQAQAAQGNMSPSGSQILPDVDPRRYRVLVGRNGVLGSKDNVSNDVGSPLQSTSTLARAQSQEQAELVMKVKVAQQQQHQQQQQQQSKMQNSQHAQQQQSVLQQQQQQDKMGFSSAGQTDTLSSYRTNDQIYGAVEPSPSANSTGTGKTSTKGPSGRKRKQPASSSGPANSTGTGNTAGRSPNSPSTPSTHTPGDVSMGGGVQSASMSKSMLMYTDGAGSLPSPPNQLVDMDRFGDDGSLDDNVESFLSHEEADPRESLFVSSKRSPAGHSSDVSKGFTFGEFACLRASASKVVCCHFSSDGKLLASAGHDKKAFLWNMDTLSMKHSLEEHSFLITDVRFSPNSARLATSSFDKTVRVWDADNPAYSLRTFTGHGTSVMSLDFHPTNEDLLCSCDGDSEIRYWNVNQGVCTRAFKGGMTQTRFQPRLGRLLAAAAESTVSIFDVDSETCIHSLQRHTKPVHSVCWDITGDYLASVSEDSVRVWALGANGGGECIHELNCSGNKFHSCVFHPNYPSLLVIGCYQSLELWNMAEKKSMTIPAHDGLIAALAQCPATGLVASASHDKCVKLWK